MLPLSSHSVPDASKGCVDDEDHHYRDREDHYEDDHVHHHHYPSHGIQNPRKLETKGNLRKKRVKKERKNKKKRDLKLSNFNSQVSFLLGGLNMDNGDSGHRRLLRGHGDGPARMPHNRRTRQPFIGYGHGGLNRATATDTPFAGIPGTMVSTPERKNARPYRTGRWGDRSLAIERQFHHSPTTSNAHIRPENHDVCGVIVNRTLDNTTLVTIMLPT